MKSVYIETSTPSFYHDTRLGLFVPALVTPMERCEEDAL
jgi:hypothetical protein